MDKLKWIPSSGSGSHLGVLSRDEAQGGAMEILMMTVASVTPGLVQGASGALSAMAREGAVRCLMGRSDRPLEVRLGRLRLLDRKLIEEGPLKTETAQAALDLEITEAAVVNLSGRFICEAMGAWPEWHRAAHELAQGQEESPPVGLS